MSGKFRYHIRPLNVGHQFADWKVLAGWRLQEHLLSGRWLLRAPNGHIAAQGSRQDVEATAARLWPRPARHRAAIVLHGLGRTRVGMGKISRLLRAAGLDVADVTYPSLVRPFSVCSGQVHAVAEAQIANGAEEICFVGHSLGGLIARQVLSETSIPGRLVTLGTPHNGAVIADRLAGLLPERLVRGGCLDAILGGAPHIPAVRVPTAVIAGGTGNRGYNLLLKGDNDGIVTVSETRVPNESLFRLVPCIHTTLMNHPACLETVVDFLRPESPRQNPAETPPDRPA